MSANSAIEWTEATWNPVRGCTKVSPGCKNCYAETFAERWRGIPGHPFEQGFDLRLVPEKLDQPLRWKRGRRIFVNSMADLFHEGVPFEYIAAVFGVMAACPQHTFQVLTKRPARMLEFFEWVARRAEHGLAMFPDDPPEWRIHQMLNVAARKLGAEAPSHHGGEWPLANGHLGVSTEDQETADKRIPLLWQCPAAVRWVSAEPLRGPLDLFMVDDDGGWGPGWRLTHYQQTTDYGTGVEHGVDAQVALDWVVIGAESGPGRRACEVEWIASLVAQCKGVEVPCFVKQDTGPRPGDRGRLSDELWAIKELPAVRP